MSLRTIGIAVSGSSMVTCVTLYALAVSVSVQVTGTASWWPYSWLSVLAAVAGSSAAVWLLFMLQRPRRDEVVSSSPASSIGRPTEFPKVKALSVPEEPHAQGHGPEDLELRIRTDQRYVVSYKFGAEIGVISPTRGRYRAHHIRNGEAGPFDSVGEAKMALWEMD